MSSEFQAGEPGAGTEYTRAVWFPDKMSAGNVYQSLQALILSDENEYGLSAFRLYIDEGWHVVVLGETPGDTFRTQIEGYLQKGKPVDLAATRPDVIRWLKWRREKLANLSPKVEGHYGSDLS